MIACRVCGDPVPEGNAFCTSCGAAAPAAPSSVTGTDEAADILVWERKIPLITNPWLVLQCIAVPVGIGIVLGLVFSFITGAPDMLLVFLVLGVFLAGVFLAVMLVLQLATGGGLLTTFFISSEGVAYRAGSTTRSIDRAVTAASALAGSTGGTGAGLLAMSQESSVLGWQDIRYISVYPSVRSVVFRSPWLISPVVLYCTEENFHPVMEMVKRHARNDAARGLRSRFDPDSWVK